MAQRDQLGGAFRGLDRGDARDAQHVAFLRRPPRISARWTTASRCAARDRDAPGDRLGADVDHVRLPGGVEMGKMGLLRLPGLRRFRMRAPRVELPDLLPAPPCVPRRSSSRELHAPAGILASDPSAPRTARWPPHRPSCPLPTPPARARKVSSPRLSHLRSRPAARARAVGHRPAAAQNLPNLGDESQAALTPRRSASWANR